MSLFINKTTTFMKYCYFRASYIKSTACECKYACKYASTCSLNNKPRKFDDCNCLHHCSAEKNDLQHYMDSFKKL
jgi:hypothetical protein